MAETMDLSRIEDSVDYVNKGVSQLFKFIGMILTISLMWIFMTLYSKCVRYLRSALNNWIAEKLYPEPPVIYERVRFYIGDNPDGSDSDSDDSNRLPLLYYSV